MTKKCRSETAAKQFVAPERAAPAARHGMIRCLCPRKRAIRRELSEWLSSSASSTRNTKPWVGCPGLRSELATQGFAFLVVEGRSRQLEALAPVARAGRGVSGHAHAVAEEPHRTVAQQEVGTTRVLTAEARVRLGVGPPFQEERSVHQSQCVAAGLPTIAAAIVVPAGPYRERTVVDDARGDVLTDRDFTNRDRVAQPVAHIRHPHHPVIVVVVRVEQHAVLEASLHHGAAGPASPAPTVAVPGVAAIVGL